MNLLSQQNKQTKHHVWHLYALLACVLLVLAANTLNVQIVNGTQATVLAQNSLRSVEVIPAERGVIYDRNGVQLVKNVDAYELYLRVPEWNKLNESEKASTLALIKDLGVNIDSFSTKLNSAIESKYAQVMIGKTIPVSKAEELKLASFTAVGANPTYLRQYLYGPLYAHIIGYTGLPDEQQIKSDNIQANSQVGKYRLEQEYDKQLRGVDGQRTVGPKFQIVPAVPGHNLRLNIDHNWQASLYKILGKQVDAVGGRAGAGMIMDSETGEVVTYVSYPSFDPNALSYDQDTTKYASWLADKRTPLVDKVVGVQAATGSTFKIFTAYTLLNNAIIDAATKIRSTGCISLGGGRFCEFGRRPLGVLDITTALARSSNIYFCTYLMQQESSIGMASIVDDIAQFGFGNRTGLNLPGELNGVLPGPEYKQLTFKEAWFPGDTCNMSIGQGMFVATTAQMAQGTNAIINGGKLLQPQILDAELNQSGDPIKTLNPNLMRTVSMDSTTQKLILDGMHKVTHMPGGTAFAYLNNAAGNVKAKTGSAEAVDEAGRPQVHSWTVGSFEFNNKAYTFAFHIYFGGGGWHLNPVARDFVNCLHAGFPGGCK